MNRSLLWMLLIPLCASSCTQLGKNKAARQEKPFGPSGIPPELRGNTNSEGIAVTPGGNIHPSQLAGITPEEDIIFTDPDNPDAALPELKNNAVKTGPWDESITRARQLSERQAKPLLIWFTDSSGRSPMCKAISEELFARTEFEEWAKEKLVRLRVDSNYMIKDPNLSMGDQLDLNTRRGNYVEAMKKRYKVLGQPSFVLLNPTGAVVSKYRGYKRGQADFYWGLFKQGEASITAKRSDFQADLAKKGYREWQDRTGSRVFAKLVAYSKGELTLVQPDGTRSVTREERLSDADLDWIREQKKQRGLD